MLRQILTHIFRCMHYRHNIACVLLTSSIIATAHAGAWRQLKPGIAYQDIHMNLLTPWAHVHVFRIDLKKYAFSSMLAQDIGKQHASIQEFAQHHNALISINGGFFDEQFKPLGLRLSDYKVRNNLKPISWWGIFYINSAHAHIASFKEFKLRQGIDFAVQSGPRLLINRSIPKLKAGIAERTALGIDAQGRVLILVTDNAAMSTKALAQLMQAAPLNAVNALNLDGGSSTQLAADIKPFHLNVHGLSNISDAVMVTHKTQ